jgi:hypothetical protein
MSKFSFAALLTFSFLSLAAWAQQSSGEVPQFSDYKAQQAFSGTPAVPQTNTQNSKRYRTVIREGAAKGPNFDGQYTVVEWGCGAGCAQFSIVDACAGKVYDPPFPGVSFEPQEGKFVADSGIRYKPESSLLVINGCPGGKDCATWYYEWTGTELKLIKKSPAKFE